MRHKYFPLYASIEHRYRSILASGWDIVDRFSSAERRGGGGGGGGGLADRRAHARMNDDGVDGFLLSTSVDTSLSPTSLPQSVPP